MGTADRLAEFINDAYEKGIFNGAWLLAENGEVTGKGALGDADLTGRKLNDDSMFELASVTKQFTASAVMILKEEGLLTLDEPIKTYFPESPYDPAITIRHLLTHTSGLPDYMHWVGYKAMADGVIYPTDILENFLYESREDALFAPGDKWEYSNTGYALLSLIVRKVSGKPYAEFLRDKIFLPAGMKRTAVVHQRVNKDAVPENYAFGMVWEEGAYMYPEVSATRNYVIPLDGIEGDGMVSSTVNDLFLWDRALRSGSILSQEAQKEMRTPVRLNDGSEYPYGFGWRLDLERNDGLGNVYHSGSWPGCHTQFLRCIDKDITFIYLSNREAPDAVANVMMIDGIFGTVLGEEVIPPATAKQLREAGADADVTPVLGAYEGKGVSVTIGRTEEGALGILVDDGAQLNKAELLPAGNGVYYTDPYGLRFTCREGTLFCKAFGTLYKK